MQKSAKEEEEEDPGKGKEVVGEVYMKNRRSAKPQSQRKSTGYRFNSADSKIGKVQMFLFKVCMIIYVILFCFSL